VVLTIGPIFPKKKIENILVIENETEVMNSFYDEFKD
jgi:hypothetical protein